MTAATLTSWRRNDRTSDISDLLPFSVGGFVLGVLVALFCSLFDALVLAMLQYFVGSGYTNAAWPQWGIALFGLFALVVSFGMGCWMFRLRRWVGIKAEPEDHDTVVRKRRHFVVGSMFSYVPLSIVVCLLMVALANST